MKFGSGNIMIITFLKLQSSFVSKADDDVAEKLEINIPQRPPNSYWFTAQEFHDLASKYCYEILGAYLAVMYVVSFYTGSAKNQLLIQQYRNKCQDFYENNFAHIGVTQVHKGTYFFCESVSSYKFFASGRLNCKYAQLSFELQKRQDLITFYLLSFIWPEKDQIRFDLPLTVSPQPLCFALVKKKEAQNYKENMIDIKYLTQKINIDKLGGSFILLGEDYETMNTIFDSKILALINKYEKYISSIHLTDQVKTLSEYPYHLRVVLNMSNNLDEALELTQMIFYLLDKISSFKLTSSVRQQNEKERQKLDELKLKDVKLRKMEELQKQKLEKLQKRQVQLEKLPRDKQLLLQEKEKKEELRKKYNKKIMRM